MHKKAVTVTMAGVLIAVGVVCSAFYIPFGFAKCMPVQHMINIIAGVLLGPAYAVGMAFCTSLIRVLLGTGSLLAFPGSMIGAFLCAYLYRRTKKLGFAFGGEIVGTGIIGAIAAYPIAALFMAKEAALFAYVIPFMVSAVGGAVLGILIVLVLVRANVFDKIAIAREARL